MVLNFYRQQSQPQTRISPVTLDRQRITEEQEGK